MQSPPLAGTRRRWLAAASLALLLLAAATSSSAQEPPSEASKDAPRGITSLEDLGFGEVRSTGRRVTRDIFFPGPGDFALGDESTLVVEFSHSNLLVPERSTMNIVLNDRPMRSIRLDDSNAEGGIVEISVPPEVIAKDFNKLTIEYAMTLGLECEDPGHPALYSTLLPATRLKLAFASDPPVAVLEPPNLTDYPYPFFRAGYPVVAPVTIVVPNNPTGAELTGAYRLAADLASRVFFDLDLLDIRPFAAVTQEVLETHQLIALGSIERQPLVDEMLAGSSTGRANGALTRAGAPLPPDFGVLLLRESPWNPALRSLLITGETDEAFNRGIDALTSAESSALFAGPEAVLTEAIAAPSAAREFVAVFTFEDVGLFDRTVTGGAPEPFYITFTAPALAAGSTAQMDLIISTSEVVDRRRSNLTVELNGETVQTVELKNEQTRRAAYRVTLPTDSMFVGLNTVALRSKLYTADPSYGTCDSPAEERLWLTYHDDSAVRLPDAGEVSLGSDLSSLPFPFAGLFGIQDTTFVVDPASPASLRGGMLAVIALGRRVSARHEFDVQTAAAATPESIGERHVVAIGLPQTGLLRAELDRVLPLIFLPDGSRALVEEDEVLTEVLASARVGAIQEAQVPWSPSHRVLAIDGSDAVALTWATEALITRALDGNVALLQSPAQIATFALERLSEAELEEELLDRFTEEESRLRTLLAFLLLGVGAALLLLAWGFRNSLRLRF